MNVVLNEVSGQLHTAGESRSAVDKVKQFITQHIGEDISREDIASHVNLNPDYLTRMFKKETGLTISEYVLQERVGMAKEMLAKTNLPVGSIAASVGYTNFSHFSKMFKKAAAIGPQDYRKLHGCLCR
ncbi:AraC family transcriptional regulator [Paenibacillus sp. P25]|nr:AraC family transcriptional regulator [Paenibacillus sp. P25]